MNLIERLGGWEKAVEALEFLKTNETHGVSEEHIQHLEDCINRTKELELLYFDSDLHLEAAKEEINRLKLLKEI